LKVFYIYLDFHSKIAYYAFMKNENCTYFAKVGSLWKVGATKQIDLRMQALSSEYDCDVKPFFVFKVLNHFSLESYFKIRFADKNVSGEFFDLADTDIAFLSTFVPDDSYNKMSELIVNELMGIDLKIKRIYRRLTLKQLSKKMNRSIGWLSGLENDNIRIKPAHVKQYVEALEK